MSVDGINALSVCQRLLASFQEVSTACLYIISQRTEPQIKEARISLQRYNRPIEDCLVAQRTPAAIDLCSWQTV